MSRTFTKIVVCILAFLLSNGLGDNTVLRSYKNGLIYHDTTISKLSKIVDSLHQDFINSDLSKPYSSKSTAEGYFVLLDKTDQIARLQDFMAQGRSVDELRVDFPDAQIFGPLNIYKWKGVYPSGKPFITYETLPLDPGYMFSLTFSEERDSKFQSAKPPWLYRIETFGNTPSNCVGLYLEDELKSSEIPKNYTAFIQYSRIMIDSNVSVFRKNRHNQKSLPNKESRAWKRKSDEYKLRVLRNRIPIGDYTLDNTPRNHLLEIASLAASTGNWDVFIRAHLNVITPIPGYGRDSLMLALNRNSYLQELKALDVKVDDLIIGSIFRFENSPPNHYFGTPHRLAEALLDSETPDFTENKILGIILDKKLDLYNRILFFQLMKSYLIHLPDLQRKKQIHRRLHQALMSFPAETAAGLSLPAN